MHRMPAIVWFLKDCLWGLQFIALGESKRPRSNEVIDERGKGSDNKIFLYVDKYPERIMLARTRDSQAPPRSGCKSRLLSGSLCLRSCWRLEDVLHLDQRSEAYHLDLHLSRLGICKSIADRDVCHNV